MTRTPKVGERWIYGLGGRTVLVVAVHNEHVWGQYVDNSLHSFSFRELEPPQPHQVSSHPVWLDDGELDLLTPVGINVGRLILWSDYSVTFEATP